MYCRRAVLADQSRSWRVSGSSRFQHTGRTSTWCCQKEIAMAWRQPYSAWVLLFILVYMLPIRSQAILSGGVAQGEPETAMSLVQLNTAAVCGSPRCDCGQLREMSRQGGPCEVSSTAGQCQIGSGECCLCADAAATMAVCAQDLCACGDASVVTKVGAPCEVVAATGRCYVSSGECCLCTSR